MLNLKDEVWIDIKGCVGYQVSNLGNVKSLDRFVNCGKNNKGVRKINENILKPFINKNTGYLQVALHKKKYYVHRLVAIAFLGDSTSDSYQVNHIDNNRTNNKLLNLEWVTPSENAHHSYVTKSRSGAFVGKFGKNHPTSKPVVAKNIKTGEILKFDCALDATKQGFDSGAISKSCYGLQKSHRGYIWNFL